MSIQLSSSAVFLNAAEATQLCFRYTAEVRFENTPVNQTQLCLNLEHEKNLASKAVFEKNAGSALARFFSHSRYKHSCVEN